MKRLLLITAFLVSFGFVLLHGQGGGSLPAQPGVIGGNPGNGAAPELAFLATTPTTPVVSTAILTAAPAGVYRVSLYYVVTTAGTVGTSITVNVTYTDAQQAQTNSSLTSSGLVQGQFVQGTIIVQQQASGNIAYTITEGGAFTIHPVLALKIAIQRLN